MARSLKKPIQETGTSNPVVKDFFQDVSGDTTAEKSTTIKCQENVVYEAETSVEENDKLPDERAASSAIKESNLPITKVSVETQTEAEPSEQSPDVKPGPDVEKESNIKEVSTQTLPEGNDQFSPGPDAKGKKKKQRPRRKRPSKERRRGEEAKMILSSNDTKSRTIFFPFPVMPGNTMKLVKFVISFWFVCSIGITQCSPVDNVNEELHAYSFVAEDSLADKNLTLKKGREVFCEISFQATGPMDCNGSPVYLINETTLLLGTKEKINSLFLETGNMKTVGSKYEGVMNDSISSWYLVSERTQATPAGPNRSPQQQHTDMDTGKDTFPWWGILLIVLAVAVVILAPLMYVFRTRVFRLCKGNDPRPAEPTELQPLGNSHERNGGPERTALSTGPTLQERQRMSGCSQEHLNGSCEVNVADTGPNACTEDAPPVHNGASMI